MARAAKTPERFTKGDLAAMVFLGWFIGLLFGGGIHNGMGVLTPLDTVPGTVTRLELDVDFSRPATSTSRYTHWIEGTTDDGRTWRIANQSAYETLELEGYPQAVEVGMGEWTDNAERVVGETWEVDQQDTGQTIFVVVWMAVLVAGGLITVVWLLRSSKYGIVPALVFAVSFFVLGGFTGELAFGWIQSG